MKPKVAIGITTYKPILDADFGAAVFEAYAAVSSRIAPYQVAVSPLKYQVSSSAEFAKHWRTVISTEIRDKRNGQIVDTRLDDSGAEWKTKGACSGGGQVSFTPRADPNGSHTIRLAHNFSRDVDWVGLFHSLVSLSSPSYAMLHIFTENEPCRVDEQNRFRFEGPIAGEEHFTSWLASSGDWRRPDSFRFAERRQYRFLSELSWANVFGPEFSGCYDAAMLARQAARFELLDGSAYVQVTDHIEDITDAQPEFERSRLRLKASFSSDVFRTL